MFDHHELKLDGYMIMDSLSKSGRSFALSWAVMGESRRFLSYGRSTKNEPSRGQTVQFNPKGRPL